MSDLPYCSHSWAVKQRGKTPFAKGEFLKKKNRFDSKSLTRNVCVGWGVSLKKTDPMLKIPLDLVNGLEAGDAQRAPTDTCHHFTQACTECEEIHGESHSRSQIKIV